MKLLAVLIFSGFVYAELGDSNKINVDELAKNLPKSLSNMTIPTSLDDIPEGTREEIEMKLEEKCRKIGGEAALVRAQNAKTELMECFMNLFNFTEMQEKIEAAKPHGNLDQVFREYCLKSPTVKQCIRNATEAVDGCLEEQEKESIRTTLNITDSVLDFVCFKEGDRIALFIAEGGQDCLNKTQVEIQECMNKTIGKMVPKEKPRVETLPIFELGETECLSLKDMQTCVVSELERKCEEPTPANIIESMFKFIIRMSPCAQYIKFDDGSGADSVIATVATTIASAFGVLLLVV